MVICSCRPSDQPHGDGDGDRCSHRLHALHSAQCRLPNVPAAPAELESLQSQKIKSVVQELILLMIYV